MSLRSALRSLTERFFEGNADVTHDSRDDA